MFNGYNDTPLISYDLNQERVEKKQENAHKWSYGQEASLRPPQTQSANRHPEFWPPKSTFVGLSNVVECTCTGCYPTSENQSYRGDTARHRPWLPRTFPVPFNGSSDPSKLPPYQWDNGSFNQASSCYLEPNVPFGVQESAGKHGFYRHYQDSRLPEQNQPGVITSVKAADFGKRQAKEETFLQNGGRQPVLCNPVYNLTKRPDGRNYCEPNEKYSNAASFSVDQHVPRLPVVEPYAKPVPCNLSENRVPSTGYRGVKENACRSYLDAGYGDSRKISGEGELAGEKRNEGFPMVALPGGPQPDYSHFAKDFPGAESQKLFLDGSRYSDYYPGKNFQDVMNRANESSEKKKDCALSEMGEMNLSDQYNLARTKYQGPGKPSCEAFHPKDLEKMTLEKNSPCFRRCDDENENMNVHARLARSSLIFNDPRFPDKTQNSFPYQNDPTYGNYARPQYPYQPYDPQQHRHEYPTTFQRNDFDHLRPSPQQTRTSDHFLPQQPSNPFLYDPQPQHNPDKTLSPLSALLPLPLPLDSLPPDNKNPSCLESVRGEGVNKNGTTKISPLRLLRKKKFINVPREPVPTASTLDAPPGLDVRKFWSTWAEEEEENVAPTQMVVLDCQNIDAEQAKLLHLYETDPVRAVHLESGSLVIKDSSSGREPGEEVASEEEVPKAEEATGVEAKGEAVEESGNVGVGEKKPKAVSEAESKSFAESPGKWKVGKMEKEKGGKKGGIMDKWTEKKFDFLKRSEESKAAEIRRQEEEKKKILETRLSLQVQSLKKEKKMENGKRGGDKIGDSISPFDDDSQSSSVDGGSGDVSELPTSEYRRNKFLDYSERKGTMVNGRGKSKEGEGAVDAKSREAIRTEEIKTEGVKAESEPLTEKLFPLPETNFKEEPCFEMDAILQKMSQINFQSKEMKPENEANDAVAKTGRSPGRKVKKKKSDHRFENEQRTDKLTLETVKFSIQKSHDLKISLKVLNNAKKCSDEEPGSEDVELHRNPPEDSKNSTELITLSYKSIHRDGDGRPLSDNRKSKRRFRRKKTAPDDKTPVLKIKKSRYMHHSERDPLATYEDDYNDNDPLAPDNPYSDQSSTPNDFHVHQTLDSAKIKLTFKRHKSNFETHYKINNNSDPDLCDLTPLPEETEDHGQMVKTKCRKTKSKRTKEMDIFAEAGVEPFGVESCVDDLSREPELVSRVDEEESYAEEEQNEKCVLESGSEVPLEERLGAVGAEEEEEGQGGEESGEGKWGAVEEKENSVITEEWEDSGSGDKVSFEEKGGKEIGLEREEIGEISLDLIRSTNLGEMETKEKTGKSEDSGMPMEENEEELEKEREANDSEGGERSCESKFEEEGVRGAENFCEWRETEVENVGAEDPESDTHHPSGASASPLPLSFCENEDIEESSGTHDDDGEIVVQEEEKEEVEGKAVEAEENGKAAGAEGKDEDSNGFRRKAEEDEGFEQPSSNGDPIEDEGGESKGESSGGDVLLERSGNSVKVSEAMGAEEAVSSIGNEFEDSNVEEGRLLVDSGEQSERDSFKGEKCGASGVKMSCEEGQDSDGMSEAGGCRPLGCRSEAECLAGDYSPPRTRSREICEERFEKVEFPSEVSPKSVLRGNVRQEEVYKVFPVEEEEAKDVAGVTRKAKEHSRSEMDEERESNASSARAGGEESGGIEKESRGWSPTWQCEGEGEKNAEVRSIEGGRGIVPSRIELESTQLSLEGDDELEEGELVESCDEELEERVGEKGEIERTEKDGRRIIVEFEERKIERRNSGEGEISGRKRGGEFIRWSQRKAQSCPPECKLEGGEHREALEGAGDVVVRDIPLPLGPAPQHSCFDLEKCGMRESRGEWIESAGKEKAEESIWFGGVEVRGKESEWKTPCDGERGLGTSEPRERKGGGGTVSPAGEVVCDPGTPSPCGIFQRSSKIKFSFTRRSRFCKIGLKNKKEESGEGFFGWNLGKEEGKEKRKGDSDVKEGTTSTGLDGCEWRLRAREYEIGGLEEEKGTEGGISKEEKEEKEKDKEDEAKREEDEEKKEEKEEKEKDKEEAEKKKEDEQKKEEVQEKEEDEQKEEAQEKKKEDEEKGKGKEVRRHQESSERSEEMEEKMEVMGAISEYMRDEFYECEDIPTCEDLTNGDDLEIEKVNDDKFRNIMQNCLDNAKKFLNVGNLKLFSCSVDDLLELDCQAPESALEEQEAQANHISRDVLLASCEDTNDELAFSENMQPPDLSMDFVPSFCSDVCPEILPVDNWPYLEEEVPSSPTKPRQDETDLIPSLEISPTTNPFNSADVHRQFHPKNGIDRRKRVIGEGCFKRFRRRSLVADGEPIRMCSKIATQRRNTVDGLGAISSGKEIRDVKTAESMRWTANEEDAEKQTLKCRVSLEKLTNKEGLNLGLKGGRMRRKSDDSVKRENGVRKKNGRSLDYKSPSWQPKVMLFRISKNELRKLRKESKRQNRSESKGRSDPGKSQTSSELENRHVFALKKPNPGPQPEEVHVKPDPISAEVDEAWRGEERLAGLSALDSIKGSLSVKPPTDERKRKKSRFRNLHVKRKSEVNAIEDAHCSPAQTFPSKRPVPIDAEIALTEMFRDCTEEVMYLKNGEKQKKGSSESFASARQSQIPRSSQSEEKSESERSHGCNKEYWKGQRKERDKSKKKDGCGGEERREKEEGRNRKEGERDGSSREWSTVRGHGHGRCSLDKGVDGGGGSREKSGSRRRSRDRSRSSSGGEAKWKGHRERSPRERWCCEVCGFNDADERVSHIKTHPFHCQSCHLAFKTEAHFVSHLTKKHKNIRNQHHCLLCELSFDTEEQYHQHLGTREHRHLDSVEKNTINTLFTLLTGSPCPVLGLVETKPDWLPNQPGTVHFYHQATPLSLALQYLKMHHDLTPFSTVSSAHPK